MHADDRYELQELFRISRTALAAEPVDRQQRVDRLGWAAREFHKAHPDTGIGRAYKEADYATRPTN